jgi:hypothetical protein
MTLHIHYTHQCPSCGAYYIPCDKNVPCPRCGVVEQERFDLSQKQPHLRASIWKPADLMFQVPGIQVRLLIISCGCFLRFLKDIGRSRASNLSMTRHVKWLKKWIGVTRNIFATMSLKSQ